jgi:predicted small metal-binding protein
MFAGKPVRCDCGYEVEPDEEDAVVAEIRLHAREAHGIDFTDEEALLVVLRAALDPGAGSGNPPEAGPRS